MKANKKQAIKQENAMANLAGLKSGELMREDHVAKMMASDNELEVGRVRHSSVAMEQASERFDAATKLIMNANENLQKEALKTEMDSKKACKSVKIAVNEIKDQLNKVDSILGDNVENKITQLERVASALKIIKDLSGDSETMNIVAAIVKK
jgi:hypothetical protein